jgi:hypothetical protein
MKKLKGGTGFASALRCADSSRCKVRLSDGTLSYGTCISKGGFIDRTAYCECDNVKKLCSESAMFGPIGPFDQDPAQLIDPGN